MKLNELNYPGVSATNSLASFSAMKVLPFPAGLERPVLFPLESSSPLLNEIWFEPCIFGKILNCIGPAVAGF